METCQEQKKLLAQYLKKKSSAPQVPEEMNTDEYDLVVCHIDNCNT